MQPTAPFPTGAHHETPASALNDECAAVWQFCDLLDEECDTLMGASLDALAALIERKTQLASRLAALGRARDARLTAHGYPPGRAGCEAAARADTVTAQAWQALREATLRARQANDNNGALVQARLDYVRQACDALRTGQPGDAAPLYGADGRPQLSGGAVLASAG